MGKWKLKAISMIVLLGIVFGVFPWGQTYTLSASPRQGYNPMDWHINFFDDFNRKTGKWQIASKGAVRFGIWDNSSNRTVLEVFPSSLNTSIQSSDTFTFGYYSTTLKASSCEKCNVSSRFMIKDVRGTIGNTTAEISFGFIIPSYDIETVEAFIQGESTTGRIFEVKRTINLRSGEVEEVLIYGNESKREHSHLSRYLQNYNSSQRYYTYGILWEDQKVRFQVNDSKGNRVTLWEYPPEFNVTSPWAHIAFGVSSEGKNVGNISPMRVDSVTYQGLAYHLIDSGLEFLKTRQLQDGSWLHSVGVTSLVLLAYLNAGYDESSPIVSKGVEFILSHVHNDGRICSDCSHSTYETSLAILALTATHDTSYSQIISRAAQWLKDSQWDEDCIWGNVNIDNPYYGGFGYGHESRPDLSNTQFALMALDAAGVPKDDLVWYKAQVFLARTQDRRANVTIPQLGYTVHWKPEYAPHNSGGFLYLPGTAAWGGDNAYGSMTGAGIWGLLLTGVPKTDERVQAALKWVANHYTWDENPGKGSHALYYYYLSMSKALVMSVGITGQIGGHYWYKDLVEKLESLQRPDGSWVNPDNAVWEGYPELATAYALLSIEYSYIPEKVKRLSWVTFILHSNVDIHIYDPLGRHVGKNYLTGKFEVGIPNATYNVENGKEIIKIQSLETGQYKVVLIGKRNGTYTLEVSAGVGDSVLKNISYTRHVKAGEVEESSVNVVMMAGLTVHPEEPEPENLTTVKTPESGVTFSFVPNTGRISKVVLQKNISTSTPTIIYGPFEFNVSGINPGDSVEVTITASTSIPKNSSYLWYSGNNLWKTLELGGNDGDNIVILRLTDGGAGDLDGKANGVITHIGGIGPVLMPTTTPSTTAGLANNMTTSSAVRKGEAPTLLQEIVNTWKIWVLALLLLSIIIVLWRR